jgi:hypothetical protein
MVLIDVSSILALCDGFVVGCVNQTATTLTVAVASSALIVLCPLCQEPAEHVHGHYYRVVAELPRF